MFKSCQEHYEQKSLWATKDKFLKWIKNERLDNYSKKGSTIKTPPPNETDQERHNRQAITWEIEKERELNGYVSDILQKRPELREKYAQYATV